MELIGGCLQHITRVKSVKFVPDMTFQMSSLLNMFHIRAELFYEQQMSQSKASKGILEVFKQFVLFINSLRQQNT